MSDAFLGRGWKFPVQVDPATGRIMMSEYEEDVAESIKIILSTSKGERMMRPDFGSNLQQFVFEETDETTLHMIGSTIRQAIMIWEPRVDEVEVGVNPDPQMAERLLLSVHYRIRTTNNLFNQVYPFYLHEGTK